jgi:hypothetical protein
VLLVDEPEALVADGRALRQHGVAELSAFLRTTLSHAKATSDGRCPELAPD